MGLVELESVVGAYENAVVGVAAVNKIGEQ